MSDYGDYDDRRPTRTQTGRRVPRERGEPQYMEETTFIERGRGHPPRELVRRRRDPEDDVEDIPREFPPPEGRRRYRNQDNDEYQPRAAPSNASRRHRNDDYDGYAAAGAGGAAAGYAARRGGPRGDPRDRAYYGDRGDRRESRRDQDQYDDDYYDRDPPRRRREEKKGPIEGLLSTLGLGGILGDENGKNGQRSRSKTRQRQWAQAAQAAAVAGAIEAFRVKDAPGPWTGEKGKRVLTAAIGAGGIDKLIDRNPDKNGGIKIIESVFGGLAANRLANGSAKDASADARGRSRSRSVKGRSRSRTRSGSSSGSRDRDRGGNDTLKNVAAGGALAAAGKAIYDRFQEKNNGRRSPSPTSEDEPPPDRRRSRRPREQRDDRSVGPRNRGPPQGGYNDAGVVGRPQRGGKDGGPQGDQGRERGRAAQSGGQRDRKRSQSSSSDSESSMEMEEKRKKMRGKEYLTAALASVATIHAAHSVFSSMEASDKRHKLVAEGEMSPEEARKKKSKAWLQDAASVGIAALGIKGAYSEWKEMNEKRHEVHELEQRRRRRQRRHQQRERERGRDRGNHGGPGRDGRAGAGGGGGGRRGYDPYGRGPPQRPPPGGGYSPVYPDQGVYGGVPPPPMGVDR